MGLNNLLHKFIICIKKAFDTSSQVYVCGFSQGGVIALYSALSYHKKIAIAGCSTYLPAFETFESQLTKRNVFLSHIKDDPVVNYQYFLIGRKKLKQIGCQVTDFSEDLGGHTISQPCLDNLKLFYSGQFQ